MGFREYFIPSPPPKKPQSSRPRSRPRRTVPPESSSAQRASRAPRSQAGSERRTRQRPPTRSNSLPASPRSDHGFDLDAGAIRGRPLSRAQSFSARSARSASSSLALDNIKHDVMVNYLYQQQCARLWVSDEDGETEGVLVRKSKTQYLACPPQLANTLFARAMSELGVQVSPLYPLFLH